MNSMTMVRPIRTDRDYEDALKQIDMLLDAKEGTEEADARDVLAVLIEDYEEQHYPIDPPDPVEAIKFRMDQQGLSQKDLVPIIGSKSKVSEVLSKRRPLSLPMIRALNRDLGIPADVLLGGSSCCCLSGH
jgi:HTH-type transcriptional regulator/antitoxin HigA